MTYHAAVLADSINPDGKRLLTVEATFPRFILAEVNTHRVFSRNSASSRAIPPEKIIKRVLTDPFIPETFNVRVKGMGVGDKLKESSAERARLAWLDARDDAVTAAERLIALDVDKSRVNRLLEPFMWHTAIISSTEWDNFFALRDHPHAQPEFQITARTMLRVMRASTPVPLEIDQWHLPLVSHQEVVGGGEAPFWQMVSAGRCARVSFDKHGDGEEIDASHSRAEALLLNGHLSPFEHQAKPIQDQQEKRLEGNFTGGWLQFRKTVNNEDNRVGFLEQRPTWDQVD